MARSCSVCEHPERQAIEAALRSGASVREVAARFGVSKTALWRHGALHSTNKVVIESGQAREDGQEGDDMAKTKANTSEVPQKAAPKGAIATAQAEVEVATAALQEVEKELLALSRERVAILAAVSKLEEKLKAETDIAGMRATQHEKTVRRAEAEELEGVIENAVQRLQRPAEARLEQARRNVRYVQDHVADVRRQLAAAESRRVWALEQLEDAKAQCELNVASANQVITGLREHLEKLTGGAEGGTQ